MTQIAIIGGGASGLFCALSLARELGDKAHITIFERKDRICKKLLATGNGRCNLTNTTANVNNYYSDNLEFVSEVLNQFPPTETITFFNNLGLLTKEEYGGRVFPYCQQATAVLDVLRLETERHGVFTQTNTDVVNITTNESDFSLELSENLARRVFRADVVVVASGGCASSKLGSDGSGFKILSKLGHKITKTTPALLGLKTDMTNTKGLSGIKATCAVTVFAKGLQKPVDFANSEVLFTDYGVSGSAIFDVSKALHKHSDITLSLDFVKCFEHNKLVEIITKRKESLSHLSLEHFLIGFINKRLGEAVLKRALSCKLSARTSTLTDVQIEQIALVMKNFTLKVITHNGFENAQITAGGADCSQFSSVTMESKLVESLYAIGEVLDVFGDCGGFNLQWAWASAFVCAKGIIRDINIKNLEENHDKN